MRVSTKIKQQLKKYARYSSILSPYLNRYLKRKTIKESLPSLIQESRRFFSILNHKKINVVLDVGANNGSTGLRLRDHGYAGRIISFEPIPEVFKELKEWSQFAPPWDCYNLALGNENGTKKLNILSNKYASSFLEGLDLLKTELEARGGARVEREEMVGIKRLDDLYSSLCAPSDSVLLKIDTQGFEREVLEGAANSLKHIKLVKMEVAIVTAYKNEVLMADMIRYMEAKKFIPIMIEVGHVSEITLHQIQADIVFTNLAHE